MRERDSVPLAGSPWKRTTLTLGPAEAPKARVGFESAFVPIARDYGGQKWQVVLWLRDGLLEAYKCLHACRETEYGNSGKIC